MKQSTSTVLHPLVCGALLIALVLLVDPLSLIAGQWWELLWNWGLRLVIILPMVVYWNLWRRARNWREDRRPTPEPPGRVERASIVRPMETEEKHP